jgi:hypothetical protein
VALRVFWFLRLLDDALWMFAAELLFGLFRGPGLGPLGMDLRVEAYFQASSWAASHGCSLELTNGGRHCWGSIARSYQTQTGKEKRNSNEKGKVALKARQIVVVNSPKGVPVRVYL